MFWICRMNVSVTQYEENHKFSEKLRDKFLRNIFIAFKTGVICMYRGSSHSADFGGKKKPRYVKSALCWEWFSTNLVLNTVKRGKKGFQSPLFGHFVQLKIICKTSNYCILHWSFKYLINWVILYWKVEKNPCKLRTFKVGHN